VAGSLIFIVKTYFFTGQPVNAIRFGMTCIIYVLTAIIGQSIGQFLSATFCVKNAIISYLAILLPSVTFSDFFIKTADLIVFLRPLSHVSFFRYGFEGLIHAVYDDRQNFTCSVVPCLFNTPSKFVNYMDYDYGYYWLDVTVLLAVIIIFQIAYYLVLVYRMKKFGK
jgi:hypothetical protein